MSKKRSIQPFAVINNASMAGDITSEITDCRNVDNISYQVKWSGTAPSGELKIQVTNEDLDTSAQNPTPVWTDLNFGSAIAISGAAGDHFININQNPGAYIRAFYDRTSGVGNMTVTIVAKGMGG